MSAAEEEAARALRQKFDAGVAVLADECRADAEAQGVARMVAWFRDEAANRRDPLRVLRAIGDRLDRKKGGP